MIESYGDDFDTIMSYYMLNGYVWVSPDAFVLAKYTDNDLFVYISIGELGELLSKIHFIPDTISFMRRGKMKKYDYRKFINKSNTNKNEQKL